MEGLKTNILFKFHDGPWGGGNQFLKALRKELIKQGRYEEDPMKATCILFNSHHNIENVFRFKILHRNKIFIHRLDGPLYLLRDNNLKDDFKIYVVNNLIADGTIFQSEWSKKKNFLLGLKRNNFETIIMNASDKQLFYPKQNNHYNFKTRKCKLIANSWSPNFTKGFDLYNYLDNNLDFDQYSMIFIGNSPISFKNIKHIKPMDSFTLANLLRESDIYITGSKNDPCSNSLIEALSCGLPCVVLNDGGHPGILKEGGEAFNIIEESLNKIDIVRDNYESYRSKIKIPKIEDITLNYLDFIEEVHLLTINNKYKVKNVKKFNFYLKLLKVELFPIKNIKMLLLNLCVFLFKIVHLSKIKKN